MCLQLIQLVQVRFKINSKTIRKWQFLLNKYYSQSCKKNTINHTLKCGHMKRIRSSLILAHPVKIGGSFQKNSMENQQKFAIADLKSFWTNRRTGPGRKSSISNDYVKFNESHGYKFRWFFRHNSVFCLATVPKRSEKGIKTICNWM